MQTELQSSPRQRPFHIPWMLGFCFFLAVALFFLWEEHKAHILGAVPYVLLLLCPVMHFFMHRGHQGDSHSGHAGPGEHGQHGGLP